MTDKEIQDYIKRIKQKKIIDHYSIPEEIRYNPDIVKAERKVGIRTIEKQGYDITRGRFFIIEKVNISSFVGDGLGKNKINSYSDSFSDYYNFVEGDIYTNNVFYKYSFQKADIDNYGIDLNRINTKSLEEETVDDVVSDFDNIELVHKEIEKKRKLIKNWIKKYNACTTFDEMLEVDKERKKNFDSLGMENDRENFLDNLFDYLFFWNYIHVKKDESFDVIMDGINSGYLHGIEGAAGLLYGIDKAINAYNYTLGAESTCIKHNSQFKRSMRKIIDVGTKSKTRCYYSKRTGFYHIDEELYYADNSQKYPITKIQRIYESFEEFANFLSNDLSDCDLRYADVDISETSEYKINENTILPVHNPDLLLKKVIKEYEEKNDCFVVTIAWEDNHNIVCEKKRSFLLFVDFVAFLKQDLSGADLLLCDGLSNISDFSDINMEGALVKSNILDIMGKEYRIINAVECPIMELAKDNEQETTLVLAGDHSEVVSYEYHEGDRYLYYVFDIHLLHKFINTKTKNDRIAVIRKILNGMLEHYREGVLLIGGDISSDYEVFLLFIDMLRDTLDKERIHGKVLFVLGNHELWPFEGKGLDEIVETYREALKQRGFYLLQNEVVYLADDEKIKYIKECEIESFTAKEISEKLKKNRIIIYGGIGFSGKNEEFNANNGIYRGVISREQEIKESERFYKLYKKLEMILTNRPLVVCSHMEMADWADDCDYHDNFVYVSGHSHRNYFYDDGVKRIYADNQIGYTSKAVRLKSFLISGKYNIFEDYKDGIHIISRKEFLDFYKGKNIAVTYSKDPYKLYLLKKSGYYCFIVQKDNGKLFILNGGAASSLPNNNIQYYYKNMDKVIAYIKKPLDKYYQLQKQISEEIKKIGGSGKIHGAIIDIDGGLFRFGYNHIYLNPNDLKITAYFAWDMVRKYVYPNVVSLLEDKCPSLYTNYINLIEDKSDQKLIISNNTSRSELEKAEPYASTDIYSASRKLRKMQKIYEDILSVWYDNAPDLEDVPVLENKDDIISEKEGS